ncbi:5-dehydro-4-deoxy-D-glucuronate isomerase [Cellulomonas sp. SG140]|uniref:5-dehydro-4-deoxy-D-glucuronate isomerase n=1 Tax=Cellulomonas sp. SG140 TaxID=2976536 RepID=UPI0021E8F62A|nr:5-dehydro-4-deoxy-D-glucuronate isomerase [Cellulomonas sp. SG140]
MSFTRLWSTHPQEIASLDGEHLRDRFVLSGLFTAGEVSWGYAHDDRILVGGLSVDGGPGVALAAPAELAAEHLLERRELAVVGLGGSVRVDGDGEAWTVGAQDVLYLPMGTREVTVSGSGRVYLVSTPAHRRTTPALASRDEVVAVELGSAEQSNHRTIRKYVHADGVESNQLVLGITTLEPGSVWNTMPPHVHHRRTEVYLYDGLGPDVAVHLMGEPGRTRQLLLHDGDVVVSPPWSVHCASATSAYSFVWAMAGENTDYADVVTIDPRDLR